MSKKVLLLIIAVAIGLGALILMLYGGDTTTKPQTTAPAPAPAAAPTHSGDQVIIRTSMGDIVLELDRSKAPITVDNFLQYASDGFYSGTIFHRVIDGFMIQGGGFTEAFIQKQTRATIKNEADNGLRNSRGTIAMARTSAPDSATAQFFINLVDNHFLNHTAPTQRGWGYAVFGKVTKGMDVVDNIAKVRTAAKNGHGDVPVNNVIIHSVEIVQ